MRWGEVGCARTKGIKEEWAEGSVREMMEVSVLEQGGGGARRRRKKKDEKKTERKGRISDMRKMDMRNMSMRVLE